MRAKLLTLIPMMGVTVATPVAYATVNPAKADNAITLNASEDENRLEIINRITELKSINKSCESLFTFDEKSGKPCYHYTDVNTMISVEKEGQPGVKDGKIERDDLFTFSSETEKYEIYYRYKSNDIDRSNTTSWGNAKKYQLNVDVPANTKDYKVQVVANCKLKNCIDRYDWDISTLIDSDLWCRQRTFMQGNLSKLSTNPDEMLMPAMGTATGDEPIYLAKDDNRIIRQDSFLEDYYQDSNNLQRKPYIEAKLTSEITLSNETNESTTMSIYFWYGFFGGGYTGLGAGSHINCNEVWFSANHIE